MDRQTAEKKRVEKTPVALLPDTISLPLEIRVHGRGGQGGVTCAKLIAATYAQLGLNVQTFGDYGAERSGAPIRAFTRVDRSAIRNRNKVYQPDHLLVLDTGLLGPMLLDGVSDGASLLINSGEVPETLQAAYPQYRLAVVDATSIAREFGIGTSAVVIINTTIVGAYAAFMGLPMEAVQRAFDFFNLQDDFDAAVAASEALSIYEADGERTQNLKKTDRESVLPPVLPLTEHLHDISAALKTGSWATQLPSYQEYAAPCSIACPAGNDVVGFIQALKEKGVVEAAEVLMRTQPLPGVCGRVCPAPCMKACNRDFFDGAVNIRSLERWIADNQTGEIKAEKDVTPYKFAVIGSGPAGLSCAFHLAVRGQKVTLYEKSDKLGGVLRNGIPAYRLPEDVLERDIARIIELGVKAACSAGVEEKDLQRLIEDYDGVIVCKGLGAPLAMKQAGEELEGVEQGLAYLAACKEEPVKLEGTVVVVGGGNTAIDCARTALRCGASSVKLVYRRSREEMPAITEEIEDAVREGVQILTLRQPVAFVGEDRLSGLVLAEVKLGDPDEDGRRRPIVTDREVELSCTTVILALGQRKTLDLLPQDLTLKENQAFKDGDPLNLWYAGDCLTGDGTVAHAIGNGRRTALEALAFTRGEKVPQEKEFTSTVAPAHIRFSHFPVVPPQKDRHSVAGSMKNHFDEVNLGLPGPGEAERCFSCGRCTLCDTCMVYCPDGIIFRAEKGYVIDRDYCKGCGICVAECPRRAMKMSDR